MAYKWYIRLIAIVLILSTYYLPLNAMLSKPTTNPEEILHTQQEEINQWYSNLLLAECNKENPNCQEVLFYLKQGANVNEKDKDNGTPLHDACFTGNLKLAIILIKHKATINAQTTRGVTPLYFACQQGKRELVKLLIEHKAAINQAAYNGATPLHIACEYGFFDIAKILIEHGADKEALTDHITTPLMIACIKGHFPIAELLIKKGANIATRTVLGFTPLHASCQHGKLAIVKLLIKHGADKESKTDEQATPLIIACMRNEIEVVKYLLQNHALVNAATIYGLTPLHIAANYGFKELCQLLLVWNADIKAQNMDGLTPSEVAVNHNQDAILTLFQQYGVSILSREQADKNMHALFADLNQEKLSKQQQVSSKKKKIEQKKLPIYNAHIPSNKSVIAIKETKKEIPSEEQQNQNDSHIISISSPAKIDTLPEPLEKPIIAPNSSQTTNSSPSHSIITSTALSSSSIIQSEPAEKPYQILIGEKLKWPRSLTTSQQNTIKDQLKELKNWPTVGLDVKKLKNSTDMYRLRVGGYRIVFSVDTKQRIIKIHEIGLRKKIYKNLHI